MSMSRIGRVLKSYLFWTHDRGSFHYDVMVTLILLIIFVGPRYIDFKDQPAEHLPHPSAIEITPDGSNGFICVVDASTLDVQHEDVQNQDVQHQDEGMVRASLLRLIRPIAGDVSIVKTEPVRSQAGRIVAYRAQIRK